MPKLVRNISNDINKKKRKKYSSKFNDQWLKIPNFKTWLKPVVGDNTQACCSICSYSFSIESGGVGALESHHGGVKHQQRLRDIKDKSGIGAFFARQKKPVEDSASSLSTTAGHTTAVDENQVSSQSACTTFYLTYETHL